MALSCENIITLQQIKGIGPGSVNKVCLEASRLSHSGMTADELRDLLRRMILSKALPRVGMPEQREFDSACSAARRILDRSERMGITCLSRFDSAFPEKLFGTVDEAGKSAVPAVIYCKGDLSIAGRPSLAVIGTREPTPAGDTAGRYYAGAFASIGVNIVSGLAIGCDISGHRGALEAGGVTTAVLATGLDAVYPEENADLAEEIVGRGGLLLSEYPVGTSVSRYNLVARDRLQAGLSDAILVVQTGVKGGTMHAVRAASSVGKPVMAVSYRTDQGEMEEGNRMLISSGAMSLRTSREEICSNPEKYLALILGIRHREESGTLF